MTKNDDAQQRRDLFVAEIIHFVNERRNSAVLTAAEIGRLDKQRLQALSKSLLLTIRGYYKTHKNADVAVGVIALLHLFSDNPAGVCTLSVKRMARFLSRTENATSEAVKRLEAHGLVTVDRVAGRSSRYVVMMPRALQQPAQLTWLLDALAPAEPLQKHGIRREQAHVFTPHADLGAVANNPIATLGPVSDSPQVAGPTAPNPAGDDSPIESPKMEEGEAHEPALRLLDPLVVSMHRAWWRGAVADREADSLLTARCKDSLARGGNAAGFEAVVRQLDAEWRAGTVRAPQSLLAHRVDQRYASATPTGRPDASRGRAPDEAIVHRFNGEFGRHVFVTRGDVNRIVANVPGSGPDLVTVALMEVDCQLDHTNLVKSSVLVAVELIVISLVMHAKYNTPAAQIVDDEVAVVDGQPLLGLFGAIGARWLDQLRARLVVADDLVVSVWRDVLAEMSPGRSLAPDTYGRGLQGLVEAEFAERLQQKSSLARSTVDHDTAARIHAARERARRPLFH